MKRNAEKENMKKQEEPTVKKARKSLVDVLTDQNQQHQKASFEMFSKGWGVAIFYLRW